MATLENVYYDGLTFANATGIWDDSNLTIYSPAGWYSEAGVYRYWDGLGVLGAPTSCPTCIVPCNSSIGGTGGQGRYYIDFDATQDTGAVIVVFNPASVPDRCVWTYDGVSASEYSSPTEGYLQGVIGVWINPPAPAPPTNDCYPCIGGDLCNSNGSNGVTYTGAERVFDPSQPPGPSQWVPNGNTAIMGPYTNSASGGVTLTANPPGNCMMVVPKPNAFPTDVSLMIDGPCGGTAWSVTVNCPIQLNDFKCEPHPVNCTDPLTDVLYTAHVYNSTGVSNTISVNDWVFDDPNGVTQKPAGNYAVDIGGTVYCVMVSADGVVTNVSLCTTIC